jgi:hypothetical protein
VAYYGDSSGKAVLAILLAMVIGIAIYNWRFTLFALHFLADLLVLNLPIPIQEFLHRTFTVHHP